MEPCRVRGADLRAIEKTRIILEWILCICSSTSRDSANHRLKVFEKNKKRNLKSLKKQTLNLLNTGN